MSSSGLTPADERALGGAPLFRRLPPSDLEEVLRLGFSRDVEAGTPVIREGDPGDAMFVVVSGRVAVVPQADASKRVLARLGPGEFFGEMALVTGEPRTAAVVSEVPTRLLVLGRDAFELITARAPALRAEVERVAESRRSGRPSAPFANEIHRLAALPATGGRLLIGRGAENDITLDDPAVARRHAEIDCPGGEPRLRAARGATVYVDGAPAREAPLVEGAELRLGSTRIVVRHGELALFRDAPGVRVEGRGLGEVVRGGRQILRDVDLAILPGELVAIVGASGAGKTTLLHTLVGLTRPTTGAVFYDSLPLAGHLDTFRQALGYVPQADIVHPDLSLELALRYAGRLRLPPDTTSEELDAQIGSVLRQLGLEGERQNLVRNLSGGQRKRASVAIELLSRPRVFFLDEPTSGLDPGLDEEMMRLLRALADEGRTVVLTTHATRNIAVCDRLVVLSGGSVVFVGPPAEAVAYFEVDDFVQIYGVIAEGDPAALAEAFRGSSAFTHNVAERLIAPAPEGAAARPQHPRRGLGRTLHQFLNLLKRDFRVMLADRLNMAMRILGPPVLAGSLLLTFDREIFALRAADGGSAHAAITILYLSSAISLFLGGFTAANAITREEAIYRRERLVDLSPVAYVLSKAGVLALFSVLQAILLVGTLASGVALPGPQPQVVLEVLGAITLTTLAGMAMGLLVSALSPNADRAATLVVLLLIPQLIFAGSTVPRSEMRAPARIISDATVSKWSLELLGGVTGLDVRLEAQSFKEVEGPGGQPLTVRVPESDRPFEGAFEVDLRWRWAALAGFFAVFTLATLAEQSRKGS